MFVKCPEKEQRGRSFTKLAAYLTQPRDGQHRALWSSAENVGSDNPDIAAKIMAFTAMHADEIKAATGHRKTKPVTTGEVYHAIMSWPEGIKPAHDEQLAAARDLLRAIGLDKAQVLLAAHNDNGKEHVHLMVNLVDPETGKRFSLSNDQYKADAWAEKYSKRGGWLHLTPKRAEKAARRAANAQRVAEGKAPDTTPTEPGTKISRRDWQKVERAASSDWQRQKAERDAAFARQGAERAELRAAHSAEWKTAKAEAARHKAAYKAAFRAAYARQKAADKIENKPAWGALFKRQEADRRSIDHALTTARTQATYAQQQAKAARASLSRAKRRKASTLGRLAQRLHLAATPEQARADQRQAAERMEQAALMLAAAELAKANLARRQEDERKALGAQLSQLTFAKAQLKVSNMPRADFAAMIGRQNAERAEQIDRQNAERAALGMKPYDPTKGATTMQPKPWDQRRDVSTSAFNHAKTPRAPEPPREPSKVQAATRHLTPSGVKIGTTPAAPTQAAQDQAREAAKAAREAPRPSVSRFAPSNDRTSFSGDELAKASARFAPKDQDAQARANEAAERRKTSDQSRDHSRDRDDLER